MLSNNRSSFGVDYYHLVSDSKFTNFIQYNKNIWSNLLSFGILCNSLMALCTFFSNSCRITLKYYFNKHFITHLFSKIYILGSRLNSHLRITPHKLMCRLNLSSATPRYQPFRHSGHHFRMSRTIEMRDDIPNPIHLPHLLLPIFSINTQHNLSLFAILQVLQPAIPYIPIQMPHILPPIRIRQKRSCDTLVNPVPYTHSTDTFDTATPNELDIHSSMR